MADWLTGGLNNPAGLTGAERVPAGQNNLSIGISLQALAAAMLLFGNNASKTMVASTRYYSSFVVGAPAATAQDGAAVAAAPVATVTGIQVLVGATGGTDDWIVELHDNITGALLATSALAGVTAGTAGTWQQIPFTATLSIVPGTYFLTLQSNGTTAKFGAYNFPAPLMGTTPLLTGSAAGTFGTSAGITPPTTYTADLGPVALLY